jgi:hypothetical protein
VKRTDKKKHGKKNKIMNKRLEICGKEYTKGELYQAKAWQILGLI